jgi:anti-sigma factor RsiW
VAEAVARAGTGDVAPASVVTHNSGGVTVTLVNAASAQAPGVVTVALPIELVASGAGFAFPLPAPVIAQAASTAAVQVRLPNGAPLPPWLAFNPQTRVVTAVAIPQGAMPLQVVVTSGGASTSVLISARP